MYRETTESGTTRITGAHGTGPAGPPGAAGTPGEKWYMGSGVPASGLGSPGDWYINDQNYDVYEKVGTVWTYRLNIKGIQGVQGVPGPTGATGATGATGPQGNPGPSPPIVAMHSNPGLEGAWANSSNGTPQLIGLCPPAWTLFWSGNGVTSQQIGAMTEGLYALQLNTPAGVVTKRIHGGSVFSVLPGDIVSFEMDYQGSTSGTVTITLLTGTTSAQADFFGGGTAQEIPWSMSTSVQRSKATFVVPSGHTIARFSVSYVTAGNVAGYMKMDNTGSSVFTPPAAPVLGGIAESFAGPYSTAAAGATVGRAYNLPGGVLRVQCNATAYAASGGIEVQLWLDGVYMTSMSLIPGITAGVRQALSTGSFQKTITAGTHYIQFRIIAGSSDANDRASVYATVLPG